MSSTVSAFNEQLALQSTLRRKLAELQTRNPAYSVRAFAQRLGLQPAATNEILKGERRVSRKMAERIAARLHLDPTERAELLKHFPEKRPVRKAANPEGASAGPSGEALRLTADQFHLISDWVHYAVLNLIQTRGFKAKPQWIAGRLGITESRARGALERLERLELVERAPGGGLKRTYARLHTTDDVFDVSIQKSHLQDFELARESLLRDPIEERDFTSLTIPVDPELLPKAKEAIRRAQDEIAALLAKNPTTEVYRLCSYLFPLSKKEKKK